MASGQIRMTPDSMRGRANQYMTEHDNLGDIISTLDTLLEELQGEWEGAASDAYASKYEELRPAFTEAQDLLKQIADALNATAEAVEETDNAIAGKFNA